MSMNVKNEKADRKLCIIASQGSLDMAYPPLILANSARMTGIETHMFFTFWGLDITFQSLKSNKALESFRKDPS
jgi:peroxiredoxin family protein